MQCGFCHIGCHYETKQNVLVTYIHEALKQADSKMRIYCNCEVEKIVYKNNDTDGNNNNHDSNNLVEAVEGVFIDIDRNKTHRIRVNSKVAIVSAGAIASSAMRLTDIDNNKRVNSYPPTNPSRDIMIVVPIISIMLPRLSAPTIRLVMPLQLANQRHVKISVL